MTPLEKSRFLRMWTEPALQLALPYLQAETQILSEYLRLPQQSSPKMHLCAIGDGVLRYAQLGLQNCHTYTAIDPLIGQHRLSAPPPPSSRLTTISKPFDQLFPEELPQGNTLFVFTFNVFAYLPRPMKALKSLAKKGDVLFISSWSDTAAAYAVRQSYFAYVDGGIGGSDINCTCPQNSYAETEAHNLKHISRYQQKIRREACEILIATI